MIPMTEMVMIPTVVSFRSKDSITSLTQPPILSLNLSRFGFSMHSRASVALRPAQQLTGTRFPERSGKMVVREELVQSA